jgi:hypothetical protein
MRSSFDTGGAGVSPHMAAAMLGQQGRGAGLAQQQHPQGPSLEHLAAAQAAQQMGLQGTYPGERRRRCLWPLEPLACLGARALPPACAASTAAVVGS